MGKGVRGQIPCMSPAPYPKAHTVPSTKWELSTTWLNGCMDGWMHGRKEKRRKGGRRSQKEGMKEGRGKKERDLALLPLLTRKLVTFCPPPSAPLALNLLFHSI